MPRRYTSATFTRETVRFAYGTLFKWLVMIPLVLLMAMVFQYQPERDFWRNAWICVRLGTAIGSVATVPFWFLLRRGSILSPMFTGAALGALAGLAGTSVLELHCPNLHAWHILISHLGVAVLGGIAGLMAGWALETVGRRSIAGLSI